MHRRWRASVTLATVLLSLVALLPPRLVLCVGEGHGELELASDLCCAGERSQAGDVGACPSDCVDTPMSVPVIQAAAHEEEIGTAHFTADFASGWPPRWRQPRVMAAGLAPRSADPPPPRTLRTTIDRC